MMETGKFTSIQRKSAPLGAVVTIGLLLAACSTQADTSSRTGRSSIALETKSDHTRLLAFVEWGDSAKQVGKLVPSEGAPEAPMAFDITSDGRVVLLDQVNRRVLFLDEKGEADHFIPLSSATFQDLVVLDEGKLALLDRLVGRQIVVMSPRGVVLGKIPLVGPHIPEGGATTALTATPSGLWVEVEHRYSVLVADGQGHPITDRIRIAGRLLGDQAVQMRREDPRHAVLIGRPLGAHSQVRLIGRIDYPEPVRLTGLVRLSNGLFAVTALSITQHQSAPFTDNIYFDFIDGVHKKVSKRRVISVPATALETFQVLRPSPRGGVALMLIEKEGVMIEEVQP